MTNVLEWLKGKKTYITAIVYGVASILNETGILVVPDLAFQLLAAFGLITLRAGVSDK
jgi:hypothetical protein